MVEVTAEQVKAALAVIRERKQGYMFLFGQGPASAEVLADLSKFCRAETSTWSEDARHHARLEGRREVWLRIQDHLKLTDLELLAKITGHEIEIVEPKENDNGGW